MSDKDRFTFEDEDDVPKTSVEKQEEPSVSDEDRGEILFDTGEELSGEHLGNQTEAEDSDAGGEQFFFDTEEDTPEPDQHAQPDADEAEAEAEEEASGFTGDEGLFGNNLNAALPDDEVEIEDPVDFAPEPQAQSGGSSKNRSLLMVLLLLIVVAGGAYYFLGLGSSTPSVPTVQIPIEKPVNVVSVPPPPGKAPAVKAAPEKEQSVTVAVPPPPAPAAKAVAETPKQTPAKQPEVTVAMLAPESAPVPAKPVTAVTKETPKPAPVKVAEPATVKTVEAAKPIATSKQVAGGAYALDAGSYLLESNRKALVAQIEKLGYEPLVTPVDATLDMTRLRLGTYSKNEVQDSLAFAREIEPGSYSVPAGDGYVIYAGTFLKTRNVAKLKERFLAEGIKVKSEPVQVVRTLSRVLFGSFATKEDATVAASAVAAAGLKAVVVKAK